MTCALGCNKAPWPSSMGRITQHLACGNLHHQLLMASRFNPSLASPYKAILDRNAAGLCALPSCEEPTCSGHSWCSRTHYLLWLNEFTSSLLRDQFCMLPGCTRHVFVDDNGHPSQFCGWRHRQKFVMCSALQRHRRQEPLPSIEGHPQGSPSSAPSTKRECGLVPFSSSLMHSLKQYAHLEIPKNIRVLEDFYEKHPWEVFTEGHSCWLIVRLKITSKGRELTTKGHYHWKQSGRPAKKCKYTKKSYKYIRRKGKEKETDQQHVESSYSMTEYIMEDVPLYSLIKLSKGKPSARGKCRKKQRSKQQSAEVNDVCSQDTVTSSLCLSNDHMSVGSIFRSFPPFDSFLREFPPLDDYMLDIHQ